MGKALLKVFCIPLLCFGWVYAQSTVNTVYYGGCASLQLYAGGTFSFTQGACILTETARGFYHIAGDTLMLTRTALQPETFIQPYDSFYEQTTTAADGTINDSIKVVKLYKADTLYAPQATQEELPETLFISDGALYTSKHKWWNSNDPALRFALTTSAEIDRLCCGVPTPCPPKSIDWDTLLFKTFYLE